MLFASGITLVFRSPLVQLSESSEDEHNDRCEVCNIGGNMLCCDYCTLVFHMSCLKPPLHRVPPGEWLCPACAVLWTGCLLGILCVVVGYSLYVCGQIEKGRGPVNCPHCGQDGITTVEEFKQHGDQRCVQTRASGGDRGDKASSSGVVKSPRPWRGRRVHPDGIKRKPGRPPKHPRPVSVPPASTLSTAPEAVSGIHEDQPVQMVTRTKGAKDKQALRTKDSTKLHRKRAKLSVPPVPARSVSPKHSVDGEGDATAVAALGSGVPALKRKREERAACTSHRSAFPRSFSFVLSSCVRAARFRGVVQRSNGWLSQVKVEPSRCVPRCPGLLCH
jgi:hypothetical protein